MARFFSIEKLGKAKGEQEFLILIPTLKQPYVFDGDCPPKWGVERPQFTSY